jgi:TolB-like protein/Tfp pilus assembly protein PilF
MSDQLTRQAGDTVIAQEDQAQPRLRLRLLGSFALSVGDERFGESLMSAARSRAMLGYLAMQPGQSETRERLATLLWGDSAETQARQSLRQCLLRMRRDLTLIGVDPLVIDQHTVRLDRARVSCDAWDFLENAQSDDLALLDEAVDLYEGSLLDGINVSKELFESWRQSERNRLQRTAADVMQRCSKRHLELGDGPRAMAVCERLIALNPLDEEPQRLMLRVLLRFQGRHVAIKHSELLVAAIQRELDCQPEPETLELIAEIQHSTASPRESRSQLAKDMPSIAVLPFLSLTEEASQEYFAEGMTEDIAAALSRLRWLLVLARNTSFVRKNHTVDHRRAAAELGVRYLLEGSVRTSGRRLRISSQLIDVETGKHIWAEKYDRQLGDIFAVQDEIAQNVVAAIEPHLYVEEGYRAARRAPESIDVWGLVVRAIGLITKMGQRQNGEARKLLERAIEIDPNYARAHAILAWGVWWATHCYWIERDHGHGQATTHAEDALLLDPNEPWARLMFGFSLSTAGQHERALAELETCLTLNPSFALGRMIHGWVLLRAGRFEQALGETAMALRMSPTDSFAGLYSATHGLALLGSQRFAEALPFLRASVASFAEYSGHYNTLISCCGHLGLLDEAATFIARRNQIGPPLRLSVLRRNLAQFAHRATFLEGLAKAGIPE